MDDGPGVVLPKKRCCYACRLYRIICLALAFTLVSFSGCHSVNIAGDRSISPASLLYPAPGAQINPFHAFRWSSVRGATGYYLQVGTILGGADIFAVGELPPNINSWAVDNLLSGTTYYARLITYYEGGSGYVDVAFRTVDLSHQLIDPAAFYSTIDELTASVRMSAGAFSNVPDPGSALALEVALRRRALADCTDYAYTLIQLFQAHQIYARRRVFSLFGNYTVGHTVVEYYDPLLQKWSIADPTFGVVYFDDSIQQGQSAAELSQYVSAESWSLIKPKFVTPNGSSYMTNYYLDPIILYLNIVPEGSTPSQSVVNDPKQFLISVSSGVQGFYIFEFGNTSESFNIDNPPGPHDSGQIPIIPEDNTLWSRVVALNDGWSMTSAPSDVQTFTLRRILF